MKWKDHSAVTGDWLNKTEIETFCKAPALLVRSVGYLVFENDEYIVLAMSATEHKVDSLLKILKCCVVECFEQPNPAEEE